MKRVHCGFGSQRVGLFLVQVENGSGHLWVGYIWVGSLSGLVHFWVGSVSDQSLRVFSFGSGLFRLFHRLRVGSLHVRVVSNDISILLGVGIFKYKIELDPKIQILVF